MQAVGVGGRTWWWLVASALTFGACGSDDSKPAAPSAGAAGETENAGAGASDAADGGQAGDAKPGAGRGGRASSGGRSGQAGTRSSTSAGQAGEDNTAGDFGSAGDAAAPGQAGAGGDQGSGGDGGSGGVPGTGGMAGGGSGGALAGAGEGGEAGEGTPPNGCGPEDPCPYFLDDFEHCSASGWLLQGDWRCGIPAEDRPEARSGSRVLATKLEGNYSPDQAYAVAVAATPPIDLSGAHQPVLEFYAWLMAEANWDGFNVKVEVSGSRIQPLATDPAYAWTIAGQEAWSSDLSFAGYQRYLVDLSGFVGETIRVILSFRSDASIEFPGVVVDDLSVFEASQLPPDFESPAVPRCTPGSGRCLEATPQLCAATRTWSTAEECPFVCTDGGVCAGECRAGQARCTGAGVRQLCAETGFFEDAETCLDGCEGSLCNGDTFAESFEAECPPAGWALALDWQCGVPEVVGPPAARTGRHVIATQIAGLYHDNLKFELAHAQMPPLDLGGMSDPRLEFWAYVDTEVGRDGFNVWISTESEPEFRLLTQVSPAYDGIVPSATYSAAWSGDHASEGYRRFVADLSAFTGQTVTVRFGFSSDFNVPRPGVYIDDVKLREAAYYPLSIPAVPALLAGTGAPFNLELEREGGSHFARWSIVSGTNADWLSIDPSTGRLSGTAGPDNVGDVRVKVEVTEPSLPANRAEREIVFRVRPSIPMSEFAIDFEDSCAEDWELGGNWECGVPAPLAAALLGPDAAYSGTRCLATRIDAPYDNNQTWEVARALLPPIDLSGATQPKLSFRMWLATESYWDGVRLEVSGNGGDFVPLATVTPAYDVAISGIWPAWSGRKSANGWAPYTADLSAYAGQVVFLRFTFQSDVAVVYAGAYIDALTISE
ncbi:MAG TPA: hypothetical protein VGK73_25160 [Polyangiaceae bacterium]